MVFTFPKHTYAKALSVTNFGSFTQMRFLYRWNAKATPGNLAALEPDYAPETINWVHDLGRNWFSMTPCNG